MGEAQNELFLQNSHYSERYKLYLTNIWADKLLFTTIVISMPKIYIQGLSSDLKQSFLVKNNSLTSAHNDTDVADDADATDNSDDTDNYNRVIGIALLKAFCCSNKGKK